MLQERKEMKANEVSGRTVGRVIDADAVQAANNEIRNRAQRVVIIAEEIGE